MPHMHLEGREIKSDIYTLHTIQAIYAHSFFVAEKTLLSHVQKKPKEDPLDL